MAPCRASSCTTPRCLEIDAAPPFGLDLEHFACRLGGFGFLRRLYDWLRSGDFVFQCVNRLPQQSDRPLPAIGKIVARFLSLRVASSWSANWTQDGICNAGAGVECRGLIILQVCGRSVTERRRQGFVDGRFEGENFWVAKSLPHFLGIESLKACDALLQPLDTPPLLSGGQNR